MIFNSPDRIAALTPTSPFGRREDGRPDTPDDLLERLKLVTNDEAWGVIEKRHGYHYQFAGNWPVQIGIEQGIFKKWGLDVQLVFAPTSLANLAALLSGSVNAASATYDSGIAAQLEAPELKWAVNGYDRLPYQLIVPSSITSVEQLRGQTCGAQSQTTVDGLYLRLLIDAASKALFHSLAQTDTLRRLASRYGMQPGGFARRFIAGESVEEAIAAVANLPGAVLLMKSTPARTSSSVKPSPAATRMSSSSRTDSTVASARTEPDVRNRPPTRRGRKTERMP